MFSEKVKTLLNEQITKEFYSAYLYLDFVNYYEEQGLKGFANWFMVQAQEERDHALLFIKYMQNNEIKVTLEAIGKPDVVMKKHIDALCASLWGSGSSSAGPAVQKPASESSPTMGCSAGTASPSIASSRT